MVWPLTLTSDSLTGSQAQPGHIIGRLTDSHTKGQFSRFIIQQSDRGRFHLKVIPYLGHQGVQYTVQIKRRGENLAGLVKKDQFMQPFLHSVNLVALQLFGFGICHHLSDMTSSRPCSFSSTLAVTSFR